MISIHLSPIVGPSVAFCVFFLRLPPLCHVGLKKPIQVENFNHKKK